MRICLKPKLDIKMASDKHQWGESGILRGKKPEEDDLLVFGYSCKLFRDDEKALFIDQGKHLIPWMGDESLKIDRYDGRGAISDLRPYEPSSSNYDGLTGLTEAERRVETLCDEERYRALHHMEDDEELYHEEELKRLRMALAGQHKQYSAVQYAYDEDAQRVVQVEQGAGPSKEEDEDDTPFVAPPELDIPVNMVLPTSSKHHAIIERTADFIAKQGGQMEVLLKAKQAGNAQFGFLSFDNELHAYYKLLLTAIRAGRYKPREPQNNDEEDDGEEDDDDENHYLHPSLATSTRVDSAPAIPSITYRPSANCAYSMLVTQIKGKQVPRPAEPPSPVLPQPPPPGLEVPTPPPVSPVVTSPPGDLQLVIDKMAMYVAKNGPDFEAVVRNKGDPRFSFLDPTHPYYMYYVKRMQEFAAQQPARPHANKSESGRTLAPVSFSIRSQNSEGVLETRSALDEGVERPRAGEAYMATALQRVSDVPLPPCPPPEPEHLEPEEQERRQAAAQRSKIAEERLRAKLLAAARERMASASKEKQVQAERKRKVAAFLSRLALEKRQIIKPEPPLIIGPQLPPELQPPPDQDDVRSLPSPSPPPTSPSPPPPPSFSITPPPPPTIGSQDSPPLSLRRSSPRSNGDRRRRRDRSSPSPSPSSHRHKHMKHRDAARSHRHRRSPSGSSRKRRHHSPSERKPHKKRSRPSSPSPSRDVRRRKRRSSSSNSSSSSSSSKSSVTSKSS